MKNILIISCILALATTSCIKDLICIDGNRIVETQSRNATAISQIENSTAVDVIYKKADAVSITVKAESNLLGHIITETNNGILEIRTDPRSACFDYHEQPVITVTSPELKNIVLSGSGELIADMMTGNSVIIKLSGSGDIVADMISCDDLSVTISGSGDIEIINAECQDADILLTGSGDLSISGNGDEGHLRITGSGDIVADQFPLMSATETISGSGNIFTRVENSLTAILSGSGNLYLKGNPTINQTVTGSGRIIKN
jgi:hypothetical protein